MIGHRPGNDDLPLAPDFAEEIPGEKAKLKGISTAIFFLIELVTPPFYKVKREKQANSYDHAVLSFAHLA